MNDQIKAVLNLCNGFAYELDRIHAQEIEHEKDIAEYKDALLADPQRNATEIFEWITPHYQSRMVEMAIKYLNGSVTAEQAAVLFVAAIDAAADKAAELGVE